jgi:formylglycine-generating enzyme required for sulfatase activity
MTQSRWWWCCISCCMLLFLQGCKITQTAPGNGWVKSLSGQHDCATGQTCTIDIDAGTEFSDTFTAVPAAGFVFSGWVKESGFICGGRLQPCALENVPAGLTALDLEVFLQPTFELALNPQGTFRDCEDCPLMAVVPAGVFAMGSNTGDDAETPVRNVTVASFAIGVFEVSAAEWKVCYLAGACSTRGGGLGLYPVSKVSWRDAKEYLAWLSELTGISYRLPTEAEWEYAARAGTSSDYFWGNSIGVNLANCNRQCSDNYIKTGPVGSYASNAFGLYDMHGNLYEWVEECLLENYLGAPTDGSAAAGGDCRYRRLRGGSWSDASYKLSSAFRGYGGVGGRYTDSGFRVVREL